MRTKRGREGKGRKGPKGERKGEMEGKERGKERESGRDGST